MYKSPPQTAPCNQTMLKSSSSSCIISSNFRALELDLFPAPSHTRTHKVYPLTWKDRPPLSHMEYTNICTQPLTPCQVLFVHFSHTGILPFSCSVYRYPTSKWVKLGTFHARDERIVQSFPLDEQLFAKYLKVLLFSSCSNSKYNSLYI